MQGREGGRGTAGGRGCVTTMPPGCFTQTEGTKAARYNPHSETCPPRRSPHLPKDAALPGCKGGELDVAGQPSTLAVPLPPVALPRAIHAHHNLGKGRERNKQ